MKVYCPANAKPLSFSPITDDQAKSLAREIAKDWLNYLTKTDISISKWLKSGPVLLRWESEKSKQEELTVTFRQVFRHILKEKRWKLEDLGIPGQHFTPWIHISGALSNQMYLADPHRPNRTQRHGLGSELGRNFPLVPRLDREGIAFSPLQPMLYKNIIATRTRLVINSEKFFDINAEEESLWFQDLMTYLNSCVSVVESLLVRIYYKAKYDSANCGYKFDPQLMGDTITRKMIDKLAWLKHITGTPLEGIDNEMRKFLKLKHVRNHLNHFDPPVFACTTKDVADWLNMSQTVAKLIWKIHRKLSLPPSDSLIQLLFAPSVVDVPSTDGQRRIPQDNSTGYATCIWPDT